MPVDAYYYDSISAACSAASGGETINALAVTVPGSLAISGKDLTIMGGYADGFGSQDGVTAIQWLLTVGTGTLTVDRVAIFWMVAEMNTDYWIPEREKGRVQHENCIMGVDGI